MGKRLRRGLGFLVEFLGGRYISYVGALILWKISFILLLFFH